MNNDKEEAGTIAYGGRNYKVWWNEKDKTVWVQNESGKLFHYNQATAKDIKAALECAPEMLKSAGY